VIIAADQPLEVLGKEYRDRVRLRVDGVPATLEFLRHYFRLGRDAARAQAALESEGLPFLSLNGPYLCQYLEARGFSTRLIRVLTTARSEFLELLSERPRAVVISTTFLPFAAQIEELARLVKAHAPETALVAGGVQVWKSYRHKQLLDAGLIAPDIRAQVCEHNFLMDPARPSCLDALIVNPRGEATLAKFLSALRDGGDWRRLENVAWFDGGQCKTNPVKEEPEGEVQVDWSAVAPAPERTYYPVQAGHGCSLRCAFCDFCGLFPKQKLRAPESVIRGLRTIPEAGGVRRVYFTDDNLFATRRRVTDVCQAIVRSGLKLRWRGMFHIGIVDEAIAEVLARSGCLEVLLGIESGDAEILRRMNKRITPERILRGLELLARHGIHTKSTFIVGFPGENERTLRNTVDLLNAYPTSGPGAHRYLFFTFAVLPLAQVAGPESRARYKLEGYGYHWRHETMDSEEAGRRLAAVQEAIKPELSPSYVLEVPELPGLNGADVQRIYCLRNLLARSAAAVQSSSVGQRWDELESAILPAPAGT
jgi:p-methyltransferase